MRFLIDMGLGWRLANWLRSEGHEAEHLSELGLEKASDLEILELAQRNKAVVLTCDRDFAQILASQQSASPSVVLFRLSSYRFEIVQAHTATVLEQFASGLGEGCILSVSDRLIRCRRLPI